MNRKHRKLYLLLTTLVLAFVIPFIAVKSIIKINAGTTATPVSGLYMKVKADDSLAVGDKVLIASTSRNVMSGAGGNPGYLFGTTDGFYMSDYHHEGHLQDSDDRIYASNSNILEFEVCQGSRPGTFAFKSTLSQIGASERNVTAYLAYCPDNGSCHHYYGIQYWACRTGFDDSVSKDNAAWEVSYDEEHGISLMRNYAANACLKYRSGYSARIWFGLEGQDPNNTTDINIYKKVTGSTILDVEGPTKKNYIQGENIDLSGLSFTFRYNDGTYTRDEIIYYDDEASDLFTFQSKVYNYGTQNYQVEYLGNKFNVSLTVLDYAYKKIDTALDDYSGIVVFIWHRGSDYSTPSGVVSGETLNIYNNVRENGDYFSTFYGLIKSREDSITWNEAASFIICFDGYNYYIKNYDGQYLRKDEDGSVYFSNLKGDPVYFSLNDGVTKVRSVGSNYYLCLNGNYLNYSDDSSNGVMVYNAALKQDAITEINKYANLIDDTVKSSDKGRYFNETSWGYIKQEFNKLSPLAQAYIKNIYYNHNSETADSIEDMIDVYDNTVTRYGVSGEYQYDDFMDRKVSYAYVNYVEGLINDIGIVTVDKADLINDAYKAYWDLTYEQRSKISSDLVQKLEDAKEQLKVLMVSITPLQQEAIVGEYTYVRFIFILKGYNELTSSDFENQLTIILDEGLSSEKTIVRTPNAYNKLTASGETYVATVGENEYTFDNAINKDDIYIIYVIKFTNEKYAGHNVKASLIYNETEYKTSGYDFK